MNKLALSFGFLSVFAAVSIMFVPDETLPVSVGLVCLGATGFLIFQDDER